MKIIDIENAVGTVLAHDLTQIIKGVSKGPKFKRGHIIKEEDLEVLRSMGKEHVYVLEFDENMIHEEDAAMELSELINGENTKKTDVNEGKIAIKSEVDGVVVIDIEKINKINSIKDVTIATKNNFQPVEAGRDVAATRIIPLITERENVEHAKEIAGTEKLLKVVPYAGLKAAIIATGHEIYTGRIEDTFTDVVEKKLSRYKIDVISKVISDDDQDMIVEKIEDTLKLGVDAIFVTGGMSVDPDDRTPAAIKATTDEVISYGTPVIPGSMYMLAYKGNAAISGLPGCVMYCGITVFDKILPRIAAKIRVKSEDINMMGVGGLL